MTRYFEYATDAIEYLKAKDKKLGAAIDAVGVVRREMDEDDLFSAIVHQIIGQQISTAAQATIWNRMRERLGEVTPSAVCAATEEELQSCGITFTKARYIKSCAKKVASGQFDLDAVREMDDAEAIAALSSLEGVGVWTAEMLLLFCLGRPDILSYGDLAIHRGMRMVHHHRKVTREMFERYRRRYSPYGSVARSCCLMAAIIAPSYFQTPCSGGFFIFRSWKPPVPMAPISNRCLPISWANRGNAPDRVVFFSPYGPFMEKSAFVCRKSRNPRVETPPKWA